VNSSNTGTLGVSGTAASYTSAGTYSWTAPAGVTSVTVTLVGSGGGNSFAAGGAGGLVTGTLTVTPGTTYYIAVGQGGGTATGTGAGGVGGGYAGIFTTSIAFVNAICIAGGGGGGGSSSVAGGAGGAGGGLVGGPGLNGIAPGLGGTQSAAGANGGGSATGTSGGQLLGGSGTAYAGGGGAGYYGGGYGYSAGGGSSYVGGAGFTATANTQGGGAAAGVMGSVTIGYTYAITTTGILSGSFSNTGTLGIAQTTTMASNVLLTGGTSSYLSNSGILSNVGAGAFFQNTTIATANAFKLDVNGTSRGAIYYSTMTTGGTTTITTNNNYGVYYNISVTGTYTIQVEATQQTSNIGKYYTFRNNTGASLSVTLTNATGITSPITISSNASATIVVAGVTSYALF
jgi:hypothetical protein